MEIPLQPKPTNCFKRRKEPKSSEARGCGECTYVGYVGQFAAQRPCGIRYAPQARNEGRPSCALALRSECGGYVLDIMPRCRDASPLVTCGVVIGRAAATLASLRAAGAERVLPRMRICPLLICAGWRLDMGLICCSADPVHHADAAHAFGRRDSATSGP